MVNAYGFAMSRVVQLSDFRLFQGKPLAPRTRPIQWYGLQVPEETAATLSVFPKCIRSRSQAPSELDFAARMLRALTRRQSRFLFLDAGIGLLPALVAHSGARRVIAFDAWRPSVGVMAKLFSQNRLGAEAIFGTLRPGVPLQDQTVFAVDHVPCFDRDLILNEEKIDTIVLTVGTTDPTILNGLPAHVRHVVITDGPEAPPAAERDRLIVQIISEGFSYDPNRSERNALLFRRLA